LSLFSRPQAKSKFAQQEQADVAENNTLKEIVAESNSPLANENENDECLAIFSNQKPLDVKIGDIIGEGAYGKVYKVLNIGTGNFIAMKQIDLNDSPEKPTVDIGSFQTEVDLYRTLEHENIVKYIGAALTEEKVLIYMEYMPGGSLSSMLKQYGSFEESIIRKFTKQILLGIDYLHQKGVIHRDIKGANILSDGSGNVKLGDFGAAKFLAPSEYLSSISDCEGFMSIKGSLFWMAPELITQQKHGKKIDIWSLGCTVIEMATASHPWSTVKSYPELVVSMMTNKCPPIPDNLTEVAKDFIHQCCQFDKKHRPTAAELLSHPFVANA